MTWSKGVPIGGYLLWTNKLWWGVHALLFGSMSGEGKYLVVFPGMVLNVAKIAATVEKDRNV